MHALGPNAILTFDHFKYNRLNYLTYSAYLFYAAKCIFFFPYQSCTFFRRFERMNKLELVQALRDSNGLSKQEAEEVVNLFFNEMANSLANGDRVEIRGFCSFFVKEYDSYTGRNPKTGEKVRIPSKKLPFFKAGKELKERVDR